MAFEVRPGVTIRRPRREVAAVMFDPRHEHLWLQTFYAPDPQRIEARTIRLLLRRRNLDVVTIRHASERYLEFVADQPCKLVIRQELESIPEGTLVRIRVTAAIGGVRKLWQGLIALRLRRSLIRDLESLKGIIEQRLYVAMDEPTFTVPDEPRPAEVPSSRDPEDHVPPQATPVPTPRRSPGASRPRNVDPLPVRRVVLPGAPPAIDDQAEAAPATAKPGQAQKLDW